jgi:hypothetical protein
MLKKILVLCVLMAFAVPGMAQEVTNVGPESIVDYFTTVIDDVGIYANGVQNQSNWEMYSGAFVDGTLASVTNTEADNDFAGVTERGVAIWYTIDNVVQENAGFLDDSGAAWTTNNDIARTDGNMPRIGCQVVAGQEANDVYMFGNECTPWAFPGQFPSYGSGFAYDSQVASVQILTRGAGDDAAGGTPTKVTNVFDPTYGQAASGSQGGQQIRFGGSLRMLSNGNFVVIQDDRAGVIHPVPGQRCSAASVWTEAGANVVAPFCAQVPKDPFTGIGIWDSLDAYDGGFVIRNEGAGLTFFNNDGTYAGRWDGVSTDVGSGTTTNIANWSGSNERVSSHVTLPYVNMVGRGAGSSDVYVTRVQASDQTTIDEVHVNAGYDAVVDRTESCTDKDGFVFVVWADKNNTGANQLVGRLFDDDLDAVTELFLVFNQSEVDPSTGFSGKHPSCHMVKHPTSGARRILVSQRTDGPAASLGLNTNDHLAIVFEGPPEQVDDWELY